MRHFEWSRNRHSYLGKKSLPMWLRALSASVPWITILVLFLMIVKIDGLFFLDKGTGIDLSEGSADVMKSNAVALMFYTDEGTLVFFDDTRYVMNNPSQMDMFAQQLSDQVSRIPVSDTNNRQLSPVLLLLMDRRIAVEEQMVVVRIAKKSGFKRILLAQKKDTNPS